MGFELQAGPWSREHRNLGRARGLQLRLLASLGALLLVASPRLLGQEAEEVRLSAEPGTVVRWVAPGTESCESENRSWLPHGDVCYFPIDLHRTRALPISRLREGHRDRALVEIGDYPYPVEHVTVEPGYVQLSAEDLARSRRDSARIGALWGLEGERGFRLPLGSPLGSAPEARNFGSRRVFNGEPRRPHNGADYTAVVGTEVLAVADGTVALAEDYFFGGQSVFLDHGDGLISMYMHLSQLLVEPREQVTRGQAIGRVGATGRVSGAHLHFGVRWRGARIDPSVLLRLDPE